MSNSAVEICLRRKFYPKRDVDGLFANHYTTDQVDALLEPKLEWHDLDVYYTTTQVDNLLAGKQDVLTEIDGGEA